MKYLLLFISIIGSTFLSNGQYSFVNITDKDGLVSSNVTCILKDHYGFMWMGTYNGLSRYDGYSFKNFQKNNIDPYGFPESYIRCLYETSEHDIYIGFHANGFARYNRSTETFSYFNHSDKKQNSLLHNQVLTFFQDSKGNIWIGTRKGLDKFNPITKTFTHYYPFSTKANPTVSSIVEDAKGNLWIGGIGSELAILPVNHQEPNYTYCSYIGNESDLYSYNVGVNLFYDNTVIYVGTERGVYVLNTESKVGTSLLLPVPKETFVRDIYRDSKGRLHIATDGRGVIIQLPDGRFQQVLHHANDIHSLGSNAVYTICESMPGIIWYGTYAGGVSQLNEIKNKFKGISEGTVVGKQLLQKSVLSIAQGDNGKIYLGTDGGGLHVFYPSEEKVDVLKNPSLDKIGGIVKSLSISIDKNNLWIGTYNKGAYVYQLKNQAIYSLNESGINNDFSSDDVWSIHSDYSGETWIGLLARGVHVFDSESRKSIPKFVDSTACGEIFNSSIFSMMRDSKNRLWIITESNGLFIYNYRTQTFQHIKQHPNGKGLPSNELRDIWEDKYGDIWIGSVNVGLIKVVDIEDGLFEVYGPKEGLNTVQVVGILHDKMNNIWISTDMGISVLSSQTKKFRNFDEEDGLISRSYNYNSKLLASDGSMYFGGTSGLTYFHPDQIIINKLVPPVLITDFKLFNHTIFPKQKLHDRIILQNAIYTTDEIELDYSDNVISLEFAALDYTSPKKALYAYKLNGFDQDWIYVDANHRLVTYTNLDPGTYKFVVKATNSDGVWNEIGDTVEIIIHPPWWKTWWFRLALSVLFVLTVFVFYKIRVQNIERKNHQLQLELAICQQELKKQQKIKDKFYTIITQDLKNPMTSLFGLAHMLSNDLKKDYVVKDGDVEMIGILAKTSRRIKDLILDLLDWTKTQQSDIIQHKVLVDLYGLVDEIMDNLKAQFVSKKNTIANTVWKGVMVEADKQMLNKVFNKIISNAIKYTPEDGLITITPKLYDEEICISIHDTGIGMSQDEVDRILQGDYHFSSVSGGERGSGIGLMVSYEFIYLMNGHLDIESTVGEGTIFHIYLPVHSILNTSLIPNKTKSDFVFNKDVLGKQILVLDDNISNRIQLTKQLQPYFNVRSVEKVEDIDVLIRLYSPDLIIYHSDLMMEDSLEICKNVKMNFVASHIPLILMSAENQLAETDVRYFDSFINYKESPTKLFESINNLLMEVRIGQVSFYHQPYASISNKIIGTSDQEFIVQVVAYLKKNILNTEITIDKIASDLSYNKYVLIGKVYGMLGLSLMDLLNLIRIEKSKEYIISKEYTLLQISSLVGFSDLNHFIRFFTRFIGVAPKDFK
ncbi:MAG: two-component regulator propeller domain-containing protein [Cytophagaceae bacterium]